MNRPSVDGFDKLIRLFSRLPGLGPRSARRAVLNLITRRTSLLRPLLDAMHFIDTNLAECSRCGNYDLMEPCRICMDPSRDSHTLVVVNSLADLWALEKAAILKSRYHILGDLNLTSPNDWQHDSNHRGDGSQVQSLRRLMNRISDDEIREVILAFSATADAQVSAIYIADHLSNTNVSVTTLARGVPVGGEIDYLDEGTLGAAFSSRSEVQPREEVRPDTNLRTDADAPTQRHTRTARETPDENIPSR